MKRIQLFELEDFTWFPSFLRDCMTRYLLCLHEIIGTDEKLTLVLQEMIAETGASVIQDTCSGSGGVILNVYERMKREPVTRNIRLQLSDLYPHKGVLAALKKEPIEGVSYCEQSVDVVTASFAQNSIQTMVSSFHHLSPDSARCVLERAMTERRAICIFEISDNELPRWLWWVALFPAWLMTYFLTVRVRPLRFSQLFFTYCIPILPFCIAWDGAVSNARTYTKSDLNELIQGLTKDYRWEIRTIKNNTPSDMLYLMGMPI